MKKFFAFFQLFLIIMLSLTSALAADPVQGVPPPQTVVTSTLPTATGTPLQQQPVSAALPVCCEKTRSGDYCQYVDSSECQTGLRDPTDPAKGSYTQAPTSCSLTTFCKPGCCYDKQGDGYCYANYPKSNCETQYGGKFSSDPTCSQTPECSQGCCVLGTQAFLSTEVRCKKETSLHPDLTEDFRKDVTSETACSNLARSSEKGCCVVSDSNCKYTSRQECSATEKDGNGFFKDKYCSSISKCQCTSASGDPKRTMCVPGEDSVYWKDSCGNPEGIATSITDNGKTYSGVCDYASGILCGDSDKDGKFTCESLNCQQGEAPVNEKEHLLSLNLASGYHGTKEVKTKGILNGESWCQYDSDRQDVTKKLDPSFAPVGSRYYRSICINGKELIEPCKDYRQEYCVANTLPGQTRGVVSGYTEARCIKNDQQTCVTACNSADPYKMKEEEYNDALKKDRECCAQTDKRDCSWIGKCVPAVGPGFRHWEGEGADTCAKASMECPVVFVCTGFNKLLGQCEAGSTGANIVSVATVVVGAGIAALLSVSTGGAGIALAATFSGADLILKQAAKQPGWHVVGGQECLSQDYLQAANNVCRSYGDCGANFNYGSVGTTFSLNGFTNTEHLPSEYASANLHLEDLPDEKKAVYNSLHYKTDEGGDVKDNPGKFAENQLSLPDCKTAEECAKKQPFYQFTHPEEETTNRFTSKALGGWGELALFAGLSAGAGVATGSVATGSVAAGFGGAGPLGKVLQFIFPKAIGEATEAATVKGVQEAAKQQIKNQLLKGTLGPEQKNVLSALIQGDLVKQGYDLDVATHNAELLVNGNPAEALKAFGSHEQSVLSNSLESAQNKLIEQSLEKTPTTLAAVGEALSTAAWVDLGYELVNIGISETKVEKVKATCGVWQAPKVEKKDQCEQCNPQYYYKDGKPTDPRAYKACSEYRCLSLGSTCKFINQGTADEACVSQDKFDVNSPKISAWKEGFDEFFKDALPTNTDAGIDLTNKQIPIYTKITLALQTDQPSQCKMSWKSGVPFKDMEPLYFGGVPTYTYFHIQPITYPGKLEVKEGVITISNTGKEPTDHTLFVRCENSLGYANEKDYYIKFKISEEPDATAPIIVGTSFENKEVYIRSGATSLPVDVLVNEPSECKWSLTPTAYQDMPATNVCKTLTTPDSLGNYNCRFLGTPSANLGPEITALPSHVGETKYVYFKCKDIKGNFDQEPYQLTLKGSDPLTITSVEPSGDLTVGSGAQNITLLVKTDKGAKADGTSECRFTFTESLKTNVLGMDDTLVSTGNTHTYQFQNLATGQHTVYVGCQDDAGNTAFGQTTFTLNPDTTAPIILQTYHQEQPPGLVIVVDEDADCEESVSDPDFTFGQGNKLLKDGNHHTSLSSPSTPGFTAYYIKCKDTFEHVSSTTTIYPVGQA